MLPLIIILLSFFTFLLLFDVDISIIIKIILIITIIASMRFSRYLYFNTKEVLINHETYELLSVDNGVARYRDGANIVDISTLSEDVSIKEVSDNEDAIIYKREYETQPKIGHIWQTILMFDAYKNARQTTTTTYELHAPEYMIK